jgi:hypothetical protein
LTGFLFRLSAADWQLHKLIARQRVDRKVFKARIFQMKLAMRKII